MQSFRACSAKLPSRTGILLALAAFADEVAGTFACLFTYVGTLALLAILGLYALSQIPAVSAPEQAAPDWVSATETPHLRGTL